MSIPNLFGGDAQAFGQTNDNVELFKAWAGTSLAYALFLTGGQIFNGFFWVALAIAAATAGVGFLLHELAHRVVARSYGAEAHFIANNAWLVLSIVIAFGGIFIAAPGAVWHRGTTTLRQGGLIAAAGPLTNIALALLFLVGGIIAPTGLPGVICQVGYNINAFLALFNMLPFGPFDGAKVFAWNKIIWGAIIALAAAMTYLLPRYL